MKNPFEAADMAEGYANSRPPVHPVVLAKIKRHLALGRTDCAVDIGCGAGLSTRPLTDWVRCPVGVEPAVKMLQRSSATAPGASFIAGRAEELPLREHCASLVTAAGSLNFVADLALSLAEIRRILAPGGSLVVYDFSQGRRFRHSAALGQWFGEFRRRYPPPTGAARPLDPAILASTASGFQPAGHEYFEIGLTLDPGFYLRYMMTETNVAHAIAQGAPAGEIREWCATTLAPVFAGLPREVIFEGYIAYFR